jgi:SAM-dependent methyltransferase
MIPKNSDLIQSFGEYNASMSSDSSFAHEDPREGELESYLDTKLIHHWARPLFAENGTANLSVLDVGAGTGRMTKHLCKIAGRCVAIEPYLPFFNRLKSSGLQSNVEVHNLSLKEYAEMVTEQFDLVFISGVLMYHDDKEAIDSFQFMHNLLRPNGLLFIRDFGVEHDAAGGPPFRSVIREGKEVRCPQILRPPEGIKEMAHRTGFSFLKWRRSYPMYPMRAPQVIKERWPNIATKLLLKICYSKLVFPVWGMLAAMNLRFKKITFNYFSYLLLKD